MTWRKIAMLTSSLAIMGAGTMVSLTNASAADVPAEKVLVTFGVGNAGLYVGEACAHPQPDGGEFCTGEITLGKFQSRQFEAAPGTKVFVHGWAKAAGGFDKWREFTVGAGTKSAAGILEEIHCYKLGGFTQVGFKFNPVDNCDFEAE